MPAPLAQLDSHIRVVTPENIGFEYRVASPFERLVAYLIDFIIMCLVIGVVWLVSLLIFGAIGQFEMGIGIILIASFVVMWFYHGLFEVFWNGQTPGKRSMSLRVLRIDGRPINAGQAVLRNFLRAVDGLPMSTHLVGLVATACNPRYQRLGDLACGTMVVAEDRSRAAKFNEISDVILGPIHELLPPDAYPSRPLARAISRYVDRRRYFGPARRAEIARHVGQVLVEQYNLPPGIDHDALLCTLYQRAFLTSTDDEDLALERPMPPLLPQEVPSLAPPTAVPDQALPGK
ncbi:MAG: RDD family protein [Aeoliella sp.]